MSAVATGASAGPDLSSALATRSVTGIALVAGVLCALLLLPATGFGIVVLLVIGVCAWEWGRLVGLRGSGVALFVAVTVGACFAALALAARDGWFPVVVVACGAATIFWLLVGIPSVLTRWQPAGLLGRAMSAWIALVGAFVAVVALRALSPWLALAAMATVWIADSVAYLVGRKFGRSKLAPEISPGKTWEGAYGGVAAAVVYALTLLPLAARTGFTGRVGIGSIVLWIAFCAGVAALSIVGDLHESLLKRRAGVKDSGTLLPGHGGVLDRTDALLAAMPPVALLATALLGAP